jgi:hypothetical protein
MTHSTLLIHRGKRAWPGRMAPSASDGALTGNLTDIDSFLPRVDRGSSRGELQIP